MPEQTWQEGLACFQPCRLPKGKFFLEQGKVCRQAAFISEGMLRTFTLHEEGSQTTTCFCSENNFLTAFRSFLLQTPSDASILEGLAYQITRRTRWAEFVNVARKR